jgi:hypothetical protein
MEYCSIAVTKVSVFPAAVSLQAGFPLRYNRFQLRSNSSSFMVFSLKPDT